MNENLTGKSSERRFRGSRAVVTGASSGIGRAIALALGAEGADLALVGRSDQRLAETAVALEGSGVTTSIHATDLSSDIAVEQLVSEIELDFPCIDVLVHSAGTICRSRVEDGDVSDFDAQFRANLRAPYLLTKALLPLLKKAQGQIVFVNSSQGLRARAGSSQFAATQHGLKAVADSLRDEVNSHGVRVLSVYPGRTATARMERIFATEGQQYRPELLMQPQDVAMIILHALALPRTAEVTDISLRPMAKCY